MQYYQYTVLPIVRSDWWLAPGSSPPLLVPLTSIGKDLSSSMSQFRLYDMSKVIYDIAGQTTWIPDWTGRTIGDAVTQYLRFYSRHTDVCSHCGGFSFDAYVLHKICWLKKASLAMATSFSNVSLPPCSSIVLYFVKCSSSAFSVYS